MTAEHENGTRTDGVDYVVLTNCGLYYDRYKQTLSLFFATRSGWCGCRCLYWAHSNQLFHRRLHEDIYGDDSS